MGEIIVASCTILTCVGTLAIHWKNKGETDAKLATIIMQHDTRIDTLETQVDKHTSEIGYLKGQMERID